MLKKNYKNRKGFTLIEILIAIAIISIISSFFIISISNNDINDEITIETEKLMADIRYARNLATSRTVHDFGSGEEYPAGGYGIYFEDLSASNARYIVFADVGIDGTDAGSSAEGYDADRDFIVKETILSNSAIELNDYVSDKSSFYFTFITENQVDTNMSYNPAIGKYYAELLNRGSGYPATGYRSIINVGERSLNSANEVEYIWGNLGASYSVYNPPAPPPAPRNDERLQVL